MTKGVFELSQNLNSARQKRPLKSHEYIKEITGNENRFVWSSLFKKDIVKTESVKQSELLEEVQNKITVGGTSNLIQDKSRVVESPNQVSYWEIIKGEHNCFHKTMRKIRAK
jgi:hypothetical protein